MDPAFIAARAVLETDLQPQLYTLAPNLVAVQFECMKLAPAFHIITSAIEAGEIKPGGTVAETTSGTFGLGLARVCRAYNLNAHLVSDPAIDAPLRARLEMLGATVDIVAADETGSFQKPRLRRLREVLDATGGYWPNQYDSPLNPASYHNIIDGVVDTLKVTVHHLVAAYGSGGSGSGCATRLAELGHPVQTHAVDTPGSVLFEQEDRRRELRGLGNSILPRNINYRRVDDVHWIPASLAFSAACRIAQMYGGLDVGPTSGAAFVAARHVACQHPDQNVLVIFADGGERYRSTYLSPQWLEARGLLVDSNNAAPREVAHPHDAGDEWATFHWNRQPLDAVKACREVA